MSFDWEDMSTCETGSVVSHLLVGSLSGSLFMLWIFVHEPFWLKLTSAKCSHMSNDVSLSVRVEDKWQSNEQQVRKESAGHKEWGRQEVQWTEQVTGGASASTDGGGGQGS